MNLNGRNMTPVQHLWKQVLLNCILHRMVRNLTENMKLPYLSRNYPVSLNYQKGWTKTSAVPRRNMRGTHLRRRKQQSIVSGRLIPCVYMK